MPEIKKLRTMYCGTPGRDAIYGAAIVKAENGFHTLWIFYCARGQEPKFQRAGTGASLDGLLATFNKKISDRVKHNYEDIDWRDTYYAMKDAVLSLGTPPVEGQAPAPNSPAPRTVTPKPAAAKPTRQVKPVAKPRVFDRMSGGPREF